jgi:cell wall-associated NlpC family hydrolase
MVARAALCVAALSGANVALAQQVPAPNSRVATTGPHVLGVATPMVPTLPAGTAASVQNVPNAQTSPSLQANASAAGAASGAAAAAPAGDTRSTDPILRLLQSKGLLPETQPVIALAQQVRDRASDVASSLVVSAMNFLGVPYRRGGTSEETGFDCSGFTRHVFENSVGLVLPRRAIEQANSPDLVPVAKADLKPGDLVFFNTLRHAFSHVGIYIGDNKFIHSPRTGGKVRVEDMGEAYWQKRFDGARRAPQVSAQNVAQVPASN